MPFDLLETLGKVSDVLDIFINVGSDFPSTDHKTSKNNHKTKYFAEKISAVFLVLSVILFFIIFKDPLPQENFTQTMIVTSLIGLSVSFVFFFILNVLELYYFKNIGKLLLFSFSSVILSIAVVMFVYFQWIM